MHHSRGPKLPTSHPPSCLHSLQTCSLFRLTALREETSSSPWNHCQDQKRNPGCMYWGPGSSLPSDRQLLAQHIKPMDWTRFVLAGDLALEKSPRTWKGLSDDVHSMDQLCTLSRFLQQSLGQGLSACGLIRKYFQRGPGTGPGRRSCGGGGGGCFSWG